MGHPMKKRTFQIRTQERTSEVITFHWNSDDICILKVGVKGVGRTRVEKILIQQRIDLGCKKKYILGKLHFYNFTTNFCIICINTGKCTSPFIPPRAFQKGTILLMFQKGNLHIFKGSCWHFAYNLTINYTRFTLEQDTAQHLAY